MASHFDWRDDNTLLFWAKTPKQGNKFFTIDVRTDRIVTNTAPKIDEYTIDCAIDPDWSIASTMSLLTTWDRRP